MQAEGPDVEAARTADPHKPVPSVGRFVHYVPHGTPYRPDGTQAFKSQVPRAAVITEVDEHGNVGLAILNPTGLFFHPIGHENGPCPYDIGRETPDGRVYHPGSWHWPPRVGTA